MTLSPEPPGIFRFGLAPAGAGLWAGGPHIGGRARRLQGYSGVRVASPQSSILRCSIGTFSSVAFNVNYLYKLCFIFSGAMVSQRAVQALVVVIKLDVFEDFTPGLDPAAEDLVVWKTLCFQRAKKCFHRRIIIAVSYPAHALIGPDNTQGFAHRLAAILAASIGVKIQACLGLAQNQGIPESGNNQFRLQRLTEFPAHYSAAE